MAESLTAKLKGLMKKSDKNEKVQSVKRGVPQNKKELEKWHEAEDFTRLPAPRGQEAFFRFLRGNEYDEDVDIVTVGLSADGMQNDARSYQFWIKCENLDISMLFDHYVCKESTKLDQVKETEENIKTLKDEATHLQTFLHTLKGDVEKKLNTQFTIFKAALKDEYENGEKLSS